VREDGVGDPVKGAARQIHDLRYQPSAACQQREAECQHQRPPLSQAYREGSFAGGCVRFEIRDAGQGDGRHDRQQQGQAQQPRQGVVPGTAEEHIPTQDHADTVGDRHIEFAEAAIAEFERRRGVADGQQRHRDAQHRHRNQRACRYQGQQQRRTGQERHQRHGDTSLEFAQAQQAFHQHPRAAGKGAEETVVAVALEIHPFVNQYSGHFHQEQAEVAQRARCVGQPGHRIKL